MGFQNACGGLRWNMRPDGLIEVEGRGTPSFAPGSIQFVQMARTWDHWGNLMAAAAAESGIPASWVLAVATEETGLWSDDAGDQATKVSSAGARGIMQIMPATGRGFGVADADELFDPGTNIDVGVRLLAKLADLRGGELPEMAAAYNSGSVCSPGRNQWNLAMADDYAGNVIKWNNAAVLNLDLRPKNRLAIGLALGAGGVYAALVIAGLTGLPRFARR